MGFRALNLFDFKNRPEADGSTQQSARLDDAPNRHHDGIVSEETFIKMLRFERKRAERSRNAFLLMLIDAQQYFRTWEGDKVLPSIVSAFSKSMRETDIIGWYKQNSVIGVIFTQPIAADKSKVTDTLRAKTTSALQSVLSAEQIDELHISFHFFPEDWDPGTPRRSVNPHLHADLLRQEDARRGVRLIKRAMDVVGSLFALILLSPLFMLISVIIKLTSKGPVLFRQERVGQYGIPFTILKFRSMHVHSDSKLHRDYVHQFISGNHSQVPKESQAGVYKITDDPRVSRVGRLLRKASLDELPQFLNVLKGEMSLVGPRPPIPYELESYDIWHRRRLLEAKPGITGLWQVNGRSRSKFDDMVRLDLKYANAWSLSLDLRILLQTPRAVLSGDGAY